MKKDLQDNPNGLEPRVYEIGYTLVPTVREEDLDTEHEALLAHIINLGGEKISEGKPELMNLAYEMDKIIKNKREKFTQGYFGWIKFNLPGENAEELDKLIESHSSMLRHLFIKTVAENTIYSEKPYETVDKTAPVEETKVEAVEEAEESTESEEISVEDVADVDEVKVEEKVEEAEAVNPEDKQAENTEEK